MYKIDFKKPIHVHFIGIGGISMSGLAEILLSEGFTVSGSDSKESPLTKRLEGLGARIFYGQTAANVIPGIELVVYTAAISPENPEFVECKNQNLPMMTRATLLGQLMLNYKTPIAISGTHGKTTTTSMISAILLKADLDPTLSIGGIFKAISGNFKIGKSDYFVTEACEYTNSYHEFFPKISLILNVEEDHLDFFKDIHEIRDSFHKFASLLPSKEEGGLLIINSDIEKVDYITKDLTCNIITYGEAANSNYKPTDISFDDRGCGEFTLNRNNINANKSVKVKLSVTGIHNIYNACAAFAIADYLGIDEKTTLEALEEFTGTDRRFEIKGKLGDITIIDDYAHHPTEIKATLTAAQKYEHQKLWCVFQPHTYTRTKAFLDEFAEALSLADKVVLADIYAAREKNTLGISSKDLLKKLQNKGVDAHYFPSFDEIENFILENCSTGDVLITMGAGDIVKIGENLLGQ